MSSGAVIVIPSRLGSTRLEEKALKPIGNYSMVEHVVHRALESESGDVYVATDSLLIAEKASIAGATPIMVTNAVETGTDRVWEAVKQIEELKEVKYIVNLQGDLPLINPRTIAKVVMELKKSSADIVTPITKELSEEQNDPAKVKVVKAMDNTAMYFSRNTIPYGADWHWHHIGIYGFKRDALERFVNLPQSHTELTEKLEQLRALENGMKIGLCIVDENVTSVDTAMDLEKVRDIYNKLYQII